MLYDLSCTPQIFSKDALESDSNNIFFLVQFLEDVYRNGMLADLNNGEWRKNVFKNINELSPSDKDALSNLISTLKDHNLIVGHTKSGLKPSSEKEWIELAKISDSLQSFFGIVSFEQEDKTQTLKDLLYSTKWKQERLSSNVIIQNEENLIMALNPILAYAKRVILIDPYFNIMKSKYRLTLNLVAKLLRSQRGNMQSGSIEIHTSFKKDDIDPSNDTFRNSWTKIKNDLFKEYGHVNTMYIWNNTDDWHDRYIITNQCGVQVGAGLDVRNGKSTWSKLDYSVLANILKDYKENSSPYRLHAIL